MKGNDINTNDEQIIEMYEKLKVEIGKKHGVDIPNNDPVLIAVTITDFLLKQHKEMLDDTLSELGDIVLNTKFELDEHIEEKKIELFRRVQEVNNENIKNVSMQIQTYFKNEAKNYQSLKVNLENNYTQIKFTTILNIMFSIAILATILLLFFK